MSDVTLLQKYLSGAVTFMGGQIIVSAVNCDFDQISVDCISNMQRYIGGQTEKLSTNAFSCGRNLIINPTHPIIGEPRSVKRHL